MVHGETTTRSALDADALVGRLRARAVEHLRGEAAIWVLVDGSDLRKPHAQTMEALQRVKRLHGAGTVPGYRTLNAIGVGRQRRGLLYHRLFSSVADGFLSESAEAQAALAAIGAALAPLDADVTYIVDAGFDDVAVWAAVWGQGHHLVCRVQHRDRLVSPAADRPPCHLYDLAPRLTPLARVATEMVVRKGQQPRPKLQPVTAVVAATPLVVAYQEEVRTRPDGPRHERPVWLVEVRLEGAHEEPWWLLTDRPVTTATEATEVFRMYRQRWAIEDAFKVGKQCLGWEDVQVLKLDAVRTLVALGWVAAGFLYELGVTLEWPEVRLLARLGGGEGRANRPPGKLVLARGLRRLLDHLATEAILADEIRQHGGLPPRIAALLGRAGPN
ncbi:MAG TPA: transposase [Thermomicrobiales bacterium]|nr:transposase [Thermomicrobiales bacterium]